MTAAWGHGFQGRGTCQERVSLRLCQASFQCDGQRKHFKSKAGLLRFSFWCHLSKLKGTFVRRPSNASAGHPSNQRRSCFGTNQQFWLWGFGRRPSNAPAGLPTNQRRAFLFENTSILLWLDDPPHLLIDPITCETAACSAHVVEAQLPIRT